MDEAEAGCLGARARPAIDQALTGEHTRLVTVGEALVLAEHIADLAPAHADVAGRDVGLIAQMALTFGHDGMAEAHDLPVLPVARIEIFATLYAPARISGTPV